MKLLAFIFEQPSYIDSDIFYCIGIDIELGSFIILWSTVLLLNYILTILHSKRPKTIGFVHSECSTVKCIPIFYTIHIFFVNKFYEAYSNSWYIHLTVSVYVWLL